MAEKRSGGGRPSLISKALHLVGKPAAEPKGDGRTSSDGREANAIEPSHPLNGRQQHDRDEREREFGLLRKMRADAARCRKGESATDARTAGPQHPSLPGRAAPHEHAGGPAGFDDADFLTSGFIPTVVLDHPEPHSFERADQAGAGPDAFEEDALLQDAPTAVIPLTAEVETAAMRFANGDFTGAEASLVGAVDGDAADDVNTWLALLDFYQATDQPEKFKARANALARMGREPLAWMVIDDLAEPRVSMHSGRSGTSVGWMGLELRGELVGGVTSALIPLADLGQIEAIQLNCRALRRIDFGAATELTRWVSTQSAAGRRVVFQDVNWLVAALFDMLGLSDSAWVVRRVE